MEVLRDPDHAERELSNAIAAVNETLTIIRQHFPLGANSVGDHWRRQNLKLRRARGLIESVRSEVITRQKGEAQGLRASKVHVQ